MKSVLTKEISTYTAPRGRFELVTVPPLRYLMVDGHGDPNTSAGYEAALRTLYPVAYALKFLSKDRLGRDYVVPPLEALWWSEDMEAFTTARDKARWDWTTMLLVPGWLSDEHVDTARATVARTGRAPVLDALRLAPLDEGLSVQTLHVGPYDDEGPVLAEMHDAYLPAQSLLMTGKHHEVYLGDPRRTRPDRLRTILRQPVVPAGA